MKENPIIRYFRPSGSSETAFNKSTIAERLARITQAELDEFVKLNPDIEADQDSSAQRAVMYILDRSVDLVAPLVHEFTYQAMACDLLPIVDGVKYTHEFTESDGSSQVKEVVLDETDEVWVETRHIHIAECSEKLSKDFKKLMDSNKAATMKGKEASLNDMKDILADLPKFQEMKTKYSVHIGIAQECMNVFEQQNLVTLGMVEQDMACRQNPEGEPPKTVLEDLIPILDDNQTDVDDKLRLFMLYLLSKDGLRNDDRRKLSKHAKLGDTEMEALKNLCRIGARMTKEPGMGRDANAKKLAMLHWARRRDDPEAKFELSRFIPQVRKILDAHCQQRQNASVFPYTLDSHGREAQAQEETLRKTPQSLRTTRPNWQKSDIRRADRALPSGGKIIVFIAGGATYSEIRSIYEAVKAHNRDIVLGTTHIITPRPFLFQLRDLRNGAPPPPKPEPIQRQPAPVATPVQAPPPPSQSSATSTSSGMSKLGKVLKF